MESCQIRGSEKNKMAPRPLFRYFLPFFPPFCPFFTRFSRFGPKTGKKGCQNLEEWGRKGKRSFLFLSRSRFLPFLSWHISTLKARVPTHTAIDKTSTAMADNDDQMIHPRIFKQTQILCNHTFTLDACAKVRATTNYVHRTIQ